MFVAKVHRKERNLINLLILVRVKNLENADVLYKV